MGQIDSWHEIGTFPIPREQNNLKLLVGIPTLVSKEQLGGVDNLGLFVLGGRVNQSVLVEVVVLDGLLESLGLDVHHFALHFELLVLSI